MGSDKIAKTYISKSIYTYNLKFNNNVFYSSIFSLQAMSFLQSKTVIIKSHFSNVHEILLVGMTAKE